MKKVRTPLPLLFLVKRSLFPVKSSLPLRVNSEIKPDSYIIYHGALVTKRIALKSQAIRQGRLLLLCAIAAIVQKLLWHKRFSRLSDEIIVDNHCFY